jgi:superfamily II DNA or RNA helicase
MPEINFLKQQRQTIDFGIKNPYSIYALEQGIGKTLCAMATAVETNSKALFVVPSYLMLKIRMEAKKWYPDKVISFLESDRDFYRLWDTDFCIISYYFLPKAEILFEWADMIVFDEAQYLKNMVAKRTEAAHRLIYENSIERCLFLTGTPIENRVYEFYSMIAMCNYDPRIVESAFLKKYQTYVDFANHFSNLEEFHVWNAHKQKMVLVQQWVGFKNVDELKNVWLKDHYIRFLFDEVFPNIAKPLDIEVPVSYVNNPELLLAFEQFTAEGELTGTNSSVKLKAAVSKAHFTADYVKDLLDQCLQVVVYSDHPDAAEIIGNKLGVKYIDGTMSTRLRQAQVDKFQEGIQRVIVATIGSLSTGIDLYASQDTVFNDFPWKPSAEDQARSRTRRNGQKGRCRYHYIYGTMQDAYIRSKVNEKRETIKAVV